MSGPTSLRWRILRSSVLAALTAQIAVIGHLLGGGTLPDLAAVITVTVALTGMITGLATKRRTFVSILPVVMATQVIFHLVFSISAHHDEQLATGQMLIFHLLAGVASAALLAHGDRLIFGLFAALRRVLPVADPVLVVHAAPTWTAVIDVDSPRLQSVLSNLTRPRRGPPVTA